MATTRVCHSILRKRYLMPLCMSLSHNFQNYPINVGYVCFSNQKSVSKIDQHESMNRVQVSFAEVVKENTKSAGYVGVIMFGIGVTVIMFYAIFRELLSNKSSNSIYTKALDRCMKDPKLMDVLGQPIKAYGEETRRGRRRHIDHQVYTNNGILHMRMQFYIQGKRKQGTVHLEVVENGAGEFVYRYLFVHLNDLTRSLIILEDNRETEKQSIKPLSSLSELNF